MIIDLQKFIKSERRYWQKLEEFVDKLDNGMISQMNLENIKELQYLYQRTSASLARIQGFSSETEIRQYLENLVARAFSHIHSGKLKKKKFDFVKWFFNTFPQTFRKHYKAFLMSLIITIIGSFFGSFALILDEEAKSIVMPFSHLQGDPKERVSEEESTEIDNMKGVKSTFSAQLMTHNIRVSIFTFALGITFGIGTILLLFYNGIILGAVCIDYILAGQTKFLIAWLLPHGSIEIPAILLAGQAGFILASAFIGWGDRTILKFRLKKVSSDITTLLFGITIMLIWAGFVESFISQYHEPKLPYSVKIIFGAIELFVLIIFLLFSGRSKKRKQDVITAV